MIKTQSAILKKSKPCLPIKTKKNVTTDEAISTTSNAPATSVLPTTSSAPVALSFQIPQISYPKAKKSFPSTPSSSPVKLAANPSDLEVIQIDDSPPNAKPSFSCSLCPFTTASAIFLKRHEVFHQNSVANPAKKVKPSPKSDSVPNEEKRSELTASTSPLISDEGIGTGNILSSF